MGTYYIAGFPVSDELYHHGIKGQKWGIRRYQNPDGSYTEEGKRRYGVKTDRQAEKLANYQERESRSSRIYYDSSSKALSNKLDRLRNKRNKSENPNRLRKIETKIENAEEKIKNNATMKEKTQTLIGNMKYADMRREQLRKGLSVVDAMILSYGALSVGIAGVVPFSEVATLGYETASNVLMGGSVGLGAATSVYSAFNAGNIARNRIIKDRERRVKMTSNNYGGKSKW